MSVYIKGMEMPKEIEPALVIDFCEDLGGKRYARFYHYRYGGLTDWHEVLEFHEPHGRLIDADALKFPPSEFWGFQATDNAKSAETIVNDAPTIIPADPAEGARQRMTLQWPIIRCPADKSGGHCEDELCGV